MFGASEFVSFDFAAFYNNIAVKIKKNCVTASKISCFEVVIIIISLNNEKVKSFEIKFVGTLRILTKPRIEGALSIIITQKPNKNCAVSVAAFW